MNYRSCNAEKPKIPLNSLTSFTPLSPSVVKELQSNIEQMNQQLHNVKAKNGELCKLVAILTDQRNYYQQQLKRIQNQKYFLQQKIVKFSSQMESKCLLINELKKANKHLAEQVSQLNENLQQTKFLFGAQEQQIERIKKQKDLIQSQWSRVIKQVNFKVSRIQKQQEQSMKQNIQISANLPLKQKVKKALKKIQRQIKQQDILKQQSNGRQKINMTYLRESKQNPSFSTHSQIQFEQDSV